MSGFRPGCRGGGGAGASGFRPCRRRRFRGRMAQWRGAGRQRGVRHHRRAVEGEFACGGAILLVVFGHLVARDAPAGVEWYDAVRYLIYRFHMPFFLYLSGYVAWLTGGALVPLGDWPALLRRRARRLLLPFLLFGLLILLGKLAAEQVVPVDNPPPGLWEGLRNLVWTTAESPATMVWFLWVLFLCTALAPLLVPRIGLAGLVVAGLALAWMDLPPVAYLDKFSQHAVFFALGCWVAAREARLLPAFTRLQPLWWAGLALSLWAADQGWLDARAAMLVCGSLAIPALHGALRAGQPLARAGWALFLGRYSMVIYLFNTIAIGLAKAALLAAGVGWTAAGFWIHLPVLMLAGVSLPILGKALVLRRIPPLDRMTD